MPDLAPADLCVTTVRTLAIDAVQKADSGHPGAPMGLAPVGWTLFAGHLRHSPNNPDWANRDRFVLSAGHASMLLYALLHLTGYDLPMEQITAFRQLGSMTPGHPERGDTPGVEITTGPLGQGLANSVGFALAERMSAARWNTEAHTVVDHRTWCICSDGDLMEGISQEAISLAGHLRLGKLIAIYDDNKISLDGPTSLSFTEDVAARFVAAGWRVLHIADGNDIIEIDARLTEAGISDGRPTVVVTRTNIGFGSPTKHDSSSAHGSPLGADEVAATKRAYGWPEEPAFLVPEGVAAWAGELSRRGTEHENVWNTEHAAWAQANPEDAAQWARMLTGELPAGWRSALPEFAPGEKIATRVSSGKVINALASAVPELIQGAADLSGSTNTTISDSSDVTADDFSGRNLRFGVREHAMGAITNALAAYGGLRPVCSTFLTFSDYMKNTIRLAGLMRIPSILVYTHDSVGLGEDGPTHQPVEHLAGLRAIPNNVVIRPADARETAAAWAVALERRDGPTTLVFSRQGLPTMDGPADVAHGAYVVRPGNDCLLFASGSEVPVAVAAAELLAADGISAQVVSVASMELFFAADSAYRDSVAPPTITNRVAVEAAASLGWHRFVGLTGRVVAIDRFGESAPGPVVLEHLGITPGAVAQAARDQR